MILFFKCENGHQLSDEERKEIVNRIKEKYPRLKEIDPKLISEQFFSKEKCPRCGADLVLYNTTKNMEPAKKVLAQTKNSKSKFKRFMAGLANVIIKLNENMEKRNNIR